ncbi:haloacid dehalogenase type II [Rhodococcus rhodnii]|nr:haloacid dehalogenase type II [Rhodococcus rhodnii]TXG90050.1 haloacid dehalogenase type II [Rhodococcus rhodnii]
MALDGTRIDGTRIDAVLFDVFGTVVDWRGSVAREVEMWSQERGLGIDAADFADRWRERYQPSMEPIRHGEREFVPLDVLHRESLEALLAEEQITASADEIERLVLAWHRLDPWPDTIEGIARLKARHIVAPLSNGNIAMMLDVAKRAGIPWDAILGAEVVRAYKPAPEAYLRTAALLALPPERCMLVAAHNYDLEAASQCGFRTAFVVRPRQYGPDQRIDLAPEGDWDVVVDSFPAVAAALGA